MKYNKIFKFSCLDESINGGLREGMDTKQFMIDFMIEFDYSDFTNGVLSFLDDGVYIRDDGRRAERVFNIFDKYFIVKMEDVTDLVIMDNFYIKEQVKKEFDLDPNLYSQSKFESIDHYSEMMLKDFKKENITIDNILDKIVDNGIDYLDDIDKEVLKKDS